MKSLLLTFILVFVFILGSLWINNNKDVEVMNSLLLHQQIEYENVQNAVKYVIGGTKDDVSDEELRDIITWLNKYPPNQVKELPDDNFDMCKCGTFAYIYFHLKSDNQIKVYRFDNNIIIRRNDVKNGIYVSYKLLADTPELDAYFRDYLNSKVGN